jgi:hypothetical protein
MTESSAAAEGRPRLRLIILVAAVLAACAGPEQPLSPQAGLRCVDDSAECIARRQSALRQLVAEPSRSWVKQPASAEAYASGVRLFAFKTRKKDLSCDELKHGKHEADAGASVLRGPQGKSLTPAQVSRGVMLAGEVSKELSREIARRCKG